MKGFYDPYLLILYPGSTVHGFFHEHSHRDQHARGTALFRFWLRNREVPYVCRFALLAMEIECALLTLWRLRACGILEPGDVREAVSGVRSYVRALFR